VLLVAHTAAHRFDPGLGTYRGWLIGIARNLWRQRARTDRRRGDAERRLASRVPPTADPMLAIDDRLDADRQALLLGHAHARGARLGNASGLGGQ
jgi:DNA-directed RNA polymerase specialized sigma24 family protein